MKSQEPWDLGRSALNQLGQSRASGLGAGPAFGRALPAAAAWWPGPGACPPVQGDRLKGPVTT